MNKLHQWREAQNLTQEAAAKMIGITPGHFSLLERGERRPSLSLAMLIQKKMGVDPSSF